MTQLELSVLAALIHGMLEIIYIRLEATASKTSLSNYTIICLNGRFGWVPFTEFIKSFSLSEQKKYSVQQVIDYENIETKFLGIKMNVEFYFTQATLQKLTESLVDLPVKEEINQRLLAKFGNTLNGIDFHDILDLLTVSVKKIDIDLEGFDF